MNALDILLIVAIIFFSLGSMYLLYSIFNRGKVQGESYEIPGQNGGSRKSFQIEQGGSALSAPKSSDVAAASAASRLVEMRNDGRLTEISRRSRRSR